jgi:hypothetical protein
VEQWRGHNQHWETVIAQLTWMFYSAHRGDQSQPLTLDDFVLTKPERKAEERRPGLRVSPAALEAHFMQRR